MQPKPKRQPIMVSENHNTLLKIITQYRQATVDTSARFIVETLIISYAKQMVTGVVDDNYRGIILNAINEADKETRRRVKSL